MRQRDKGKRQAQSDRANRADYVEPTKQLRFLHPYFEERVRI
jgi:hypothetical protein